MLNQLEENCQTAVDEVEILKEQLSALITDFNSVQSGQNQSGSIAKESEGAATQASTEVSRAEKAINDANQSLSQINESIENAIELSADSI